MSKAGRVAEVGDLVTATKRKKGEKIREMTFFLVNGSTVVPKGAEGARVVSNGLPVAQALLGLRVGQIGRVQVGTPEERHLQPADKARVHNYYELKVTAIERPEQHDSQAEEG